MFVRALAALFVATVTTTMPASAQQGLPRMLYSRGVATPQGIAGEVLNRHNVERRQAGVAPLMWDPALAQGAQAYANELARLNLLRHSPRAGRRGIGENLWMGTRDYFPLSRMVADWASERSMFRPGIFPAVATTGNWADVGHYTQIVWRTTQRVGCAIGKSARSDVLVCRYWPAGNIDGRRVP